MSRRNKEVIESSDVGTMPEEVGGAPHTNGDAPPKPKESKAERFARLLDKRMLATIKRLKQVENLANRNQYEYTQEHVQEIMGALNKMVARIKSAFDDSPVVTDNWRV